jgi:hypothetical protein
MNRKHRKLEDSGRCQICGMEEESGHHAMVTCTKVAGLRALMRQRWLLPSENMFRRAGPEWLSTRLSSANKDMRGKILLLL